jgi:cytochrome c5
MIVVAGASSTRSQSSSPGDSKVANANQVVHITLPDYSGEVPEGPNEQVYGRNCLICHSARYLTTQPGFSRETWEKEVKKMVDSYGAAISEADQRKIVEYLVAVRGVPGSQ